MDKKKVKLIAGILNTTGKTLFWKDEIGINIGDYAVVENANGFDLIKVIGVLEIKATDLIIED